MEHKVVWQEEVGEKKKKKRERLHLLSVCIVSRGRTTQMRTTNLLTITALLCHVGPVLLFVVLLPKNLLFRNQRYYCPTLYTVHLQTRERATPFARPGS
jgi:hypothetical protein